MKLLEQIEKVMTYPFVAKGITQGGSYGIEYIQSREYYEKIARTFDFDDEIIIERFIKGKFITAPILEIDKVPTALQII